MFPGSLDDRDALRAATLMGGEPQTLWHGDADLGGVDAVILPGGFSYGDYLRTGAIARFATVMDAVGAFAEDGGLVLGICNGFQILCEAGLLPGALIRNRTLSFVCRWVNIRAERGLQTIAAGDVLSVPIKHGEGQFVASEAELDRIERDGLVAFRYCSPGGVVDDAFNPNGAARGYGERVYGAPGKARRGNGTSIPAGPATSARHGGPSMPFWLTRSSTDCSISAVSAWISACFRPATDLPCSVAMSARDFPAWSSFISWSGESPR